MVKVMNDQRKGDNVVYCGFKRHDIEELPKRKGKNGECIYACSDYAIALMEIYRSNGDLDFFKDIDENGMPFIVERREYFNFA